jgi:HPt (histidine-containing phosphotransfer) domain-containing protein
LKDKLATKLKYWSHFLSAQPTCPAQMPEPSSVPSKETVCEMSLSHSPCSSPIDWAILQQICDGDQEFALELLRVFAEDTQSHLAILKEAIATHDFQVIEQQAHRLKGASANVGITSMQAIATELELQARRSNLENPTQQLHELNQILKQLQTCLKDYENSSASGKISVLE